MPESKANRLKDARSAYLRSAAHQPVDWFPWGEEALARARQEQKPILLDIGAVWCHWCHVMDRESYENSETAALINQHFIAVKVDRDESPDIDARYQAAISAISGEGGWPLTAFLTPGGKPFFGGTYFPPDDQYGRPGFRRILSGVAENFQKRRDEIEDSAGRLTEALRSADAFGGTKASFDPQRAVNAVIENAHQICDFRHGGFGRAPKFPHPAVLDLLLEAHQINQDENALRMVTLALDGMARGGVYDQLAGGFHRYSVDERWHVPHFEKMSYDNSELLRNYLHGFQVTGDPFYREVAEGIIGWVNATLSDQQRGGFYASQDADYSLEDDGDYFTWTLEEVRACLTEEETALVRARYNIRTVGDMHHNREKNVLCLNRAPEELMEEYKQPVEVIERRLAAAREKMLRARVQRPTPFVDTTLYIAWNAMFISAYLEAARVLERDDCRRHALRTLDRMVESAWSERWGFAHRCPEEGKEGTVAEESWSGGMLDDQVFTVHALLDAYEVTGEIRYFDRAEQTMKLCLEHYWDAKAGGFFDRPVDAPPIAAEVDIPRKPFQDSPTPGGNSVAAMALDRLYGYSLNEEYREKAQQTLETFAGAVASHGMFAASYGLAALLHARYPVKVVIAGPKDDPRTQALERAATGHFRLGKAVLVFEPQQVEADHLPPGLAMTLPHLNKEEPVAVVCGNQTCQPPVTTSEALVEAIRIAVK